jgi:hypothetical protein
MTTTLVKDEVSILSRALAPDAGGLSAEAARAILAIELSPTDRAELQRLAHGAKDGSLTPEEHADLENYRHVGRLLELMKSKARISLKQSTDAAHES